MNTLLIDNYDSFTFNLYQLLAIYGAEVRVRLNDQVTEADLAQADAIVISPGPGRPSDAGCCLQVVRDYAGRVPILGVCLGHQCIAEAFGGRVIRAERLLHGKTSRVYHDGNGLFTGLPQPIEVGRYHSLIVEEAGLPTELEISAYTRDGEIMGLRHRELPIEGLQFHPESIVTTDGPAMLARFVERVPALSR